VAVKIKLKRLGRTRVPTYRIVVADARTKRDGRAIEEIGKYHPKEEPSLIEVNSERAQHWLSVGAQPTPPVMNILKITGDWQKFKGEPGAEGTLRTREQSATKQETFANALKEAGKSKDDSGSTTPKGGGRAKKSDSKASDTKTDAKADSKTEAKADTDTKAEAKADTKPESGRSKSKASAEKPAAGAADDSAAAAATAEAEPATADATASTDSASTDSASAEAASESSESGSEA
jgi:small subunit ribosomal protein S16